MSTAFRRLGAPNALVDDACRLWPLYGGSWVQFAQTPVAWAGGKTVLPLNSPFAVKVTWPVGVTRPSSYALYIEHHSAVPVAVGPTVMGRLTSKQDRAGCAADAGNWAV